MAAATFGSYLCIVAAYMAGMFLVTRLGRGVLMDDDRVSRTYTILLCHTWFAASLLGAYICCGVSPLRPYGPVLFPVLLAFTSGFVLWRNLRQLPGQQSLFATAGVALMIVAGNVGGLYLRHAL